MSFLEAADYLRASGLSESCVHDARSPEEILLRREAVDHFMSAITDFSPVEVECFTLRYVNGVTMRETAMLLSKKHGKFISEVQVGVIARTVKDRARCKVVRDLVEAGHWPVSFWPNLRRTFAFGYEYL